MWHRVDRMVERAMNYAQLDPSIMDNIDSDAWIRGSGRNDGVPAEIIRPEKDREAIREARAEAQAQQMELDQAQQAADAAGIAPRRKVDPGPAFPMQTLREACGFQGLPER